MEGKRRERERKVRRSKESIGLQVAESI